MKSFVAVLIFSVLAVAVIAVPTPDAMENIHHESELESLLRYEPEIAAENEELLRQKKSYGAAPAPTYAAPSHAAPAPSYAAPAPSYAAPAPAPAYPSPKLSYSVPAPSIPCSRSVIVSCAPSVIPAPCSAPPAAY